MLHQPNPDAIAVVRQFNDAINGRDIDALAAAMTDTHRFVDTAGSTAEGKDACLAAWRGFFDAYPGYRNVFEEMADGGDGIVTVRGYSTSTTPELDGPAEWRAVVRDGRVDLWQVAEPDPAIPPSAKWALRRSLKVASEALLWKLDGLSEYDVRRPMTPTGTNLLGLVKHVASVEAGYLGETFGRPFPRAAAVVRGRRRAQRRHVGDRRRVARRHRRPVPPGLGALRRHHRRAAARRRRPRAVVAGRRGEVTLHRILVHMIAETHRHAGHADIVRELIDGAAGLRRDNDNLPDARRPGGPAYRERLEDAARRAGGPTPPDGAAH